VSTSYPDVSSGGADTIKTSVARLTPDGPLHLAEAVAGSLVDRIETGDATYLVFVSYPADADWLDDFTTYVVTLTADGLLLDDFPGVGGETRRGISTVGDTRYVTTTSGVWAISVDGGRLYSIQT
jgi:hypothetical protein